MSYHGFGSTIRLEAGFRPRLAGGLVLLFLLPMVLVLVSAIPWWAKLPALGIVLLGLRSALGFWAVPGERRCALQWSLNGGWELIFTDGRRQSARLLRAAWIWPRVVLLRLRTPDGGRHWLALTDHPDRTEFRRLRVHLRWSHT